MSPQPPSTGGALPWFLSLVAHGLIALLMVLLPSPSPERTPPPIELMEPPPPPPTVQKKQEAPPPKPRSMQPRPVPSQPLRPPPRPPKRPPTTPPPPPPAAKPEPPAPPPSFGLELSGTARAPSGQGVAVPEGESLNTLPSNRRKKKEKKRGKPRGGRGFKRNYSAGERAPLAVVSTMPKVKQRSSSECRDVLQNVGVEGRVVLKLTVDGKGKVAKAQVMKGLHPELDRCAQKAAKKMTFAPATVDGVAVQVTIPYVFTFVLD